MIKWTPHLPPCWYVRMEWNKGALRLDPAFHSCCAASCALLSLSSSALFRSLGRSSPFTNPAWALSTRINVCEAAGRQALQYGVDPALMLFFLCSSGRIELWLLYAWTPLIFHVYSLFTALLNFLAAVKKILAKKPFREKGFVSVTIQVDTICSVQKGMAAKARQLHVASVSRKQGQMHAHVQLGSQPMPWFRPQYDGSSYLN